MFLSRFDAVEDSKMRKQDRPGKITWGIVRRKSLRRALRSTVDKKLRNRLPSCNHDVHCKRCPFILGTELLGTLHVCVLVLMCIIAAKGYPVMYSVYAHSVHLPCDRSPNDNFSAFHADPLLSHNLIFNQ
mgnify:CR=1 FL=1